MDVDAGVTSDVATSWTTGLVVAAAVAVLATVAGLWRRRTEGRLARREGGEPARLSGEDLAHNLGSRLTLVQFSTAFCQPCRANRQVLSHVAGSTDGVVHVDIDAESNLHLVRRLNVTRTPTTFVLGPDGVVLRRATGPLRLAEVRDTVRRLAGS